MAIFRKIHVSFWSDSYTSELKDNEKLFYIYLLTNERTTQLGVYEITKKQMAFDLGYSIIEVSLLIDKLQKDQKILYNSQTSEVAIKNWKKFNFNPSIKVQSLVNKEIERIKDKKLIDYVYSTDTVSIHLPQEEEEEDIEQEEEKKEDQEPENPFLKSIIENQIIEPFEGQDFKEAWHAWKIKRSQMMNPIRPSDEKLAIKVLWEESKGDKITAIKAIEKSIASGHSSLNPKPEPTFKPKEEPKKTKRVYE